MIFDKDNVYTTVNAEELEAGDIVFYSDSLGNLKECVKESNEKYLGELEPILSDNNICRFKIKDKSSSWALVYLVARHDDPNKDAKVAYARGKQIQCRSNPAYRWIDDANPTWNDVFEYRIKPEHEESARMTYRQLAEYMKGNDKEFREYLKGDGIVRSNVDYSLEDENKECDECIKVRSNFGEWIEPTVDVYMEDCK